MKLYATTTSERASKGQGGKVLDIDIQAGDERAHWLRIIVEYKDGESDKYGARVRFVSADGLYVLYNLQSAIREAIREAKGEKQKGECNDCTEGVTVYPKTEDGKCSWCGRTK